MLLIPYILRTTIVQLGVLINSFEMFGLSWICTVPFQLHQLMYKYKNDENAVGLYAALNKCEITTMTNCKCNKL